MRLKPVRTAKKEELPWEINTTYKFHSEGRYPEILIKIGGKLFIDLDAFEDLARKKRDEQVAKAKKLRRGVGDDWRNQVGKKLRVTSGDDDEETVDDAKAGFGG